MYGNDLRLEAIGEVNINRITADQIYFNLSHLLM